MGWRACKILFALFAVFLLFLSCESVNLKQCDSVEHFEKASQNDSFLKNNDSILIWILPEETLFKVELNEDSVAFKEGDFFFVAWTYLFYPVGILAPPSTLG